MENYVRTAHVTLHQSADYAHVEVLFGCSPAGDLERTSLEYFRMYDNGDLKDDHYLGMPHISTQQNRPVTQHDMDRAYPAYAWEDGLGIRTGNSIHKNEAIAAARFLMNVDRKVRSLVKRNGIPYSTFGLYILYVCQVLKIKQISVQYVDDCGEIVSRYMITDLGEIVKYLDGAILRKHNNWNETKWTYRW